MFRCKCLLRYPNQFSPNDYNVKLRYIVMYATNLKKHLKNIVYSKCDHEYEQLFKVEESIEILKITGLINNMEKYQKICNHACRKHK